VTTGPWAALPAPATQWVAVVRAEPTRPPGLDPDIDPDDVTPGVPAFLAIFGVALATVLLMRNMTTRLRRIQRRAERGEPGEPREPGEPQEPGEPRTAPGPDDRRDEGGASGGERTGGDGPRPGQDGRGQGRDHDGG